MHAPHSRYVAFCFPHMLCFFIGLCSSALEALCSISLDGLWCTVANIMHVSHAGNRSFQQAGLNLIRQMLQKAAIARAVPKALAAKADLLAAEKKVSAGCLLLPAVDAKLLDCVGLHFSWHAFSAPGAFYEKTIEPGVPNHCLLCWLQNLCVTPHKGICGFLCRYFQS